MTTALDYLHKSVQTTHVWTKELKLAIGWADEHRAFRALVAVLRALRDSLTDAEVLQLGSQLPVLLAGHYYQGWKLGTPAVRDRSQEAFLGEIDACFHPEEGIDHAEFVGDLRAAEHRHEGALRPVAQPEQDLDLPLQEQAHR